MHGKILAVLVAEGDRVEQGRRLAVIEAMKMEHVLIAPSAGRVVDVSVSLGAQVAEGTRLMTIEAIET
jgi:3-methylcrotonyl-CoA carboxylase alpha subunit